MRNILITFFKDLFNSKDVSLFNQSIPRKPISNLPKNSSNNREIYLFRSCKFDMGKHETIFDLFRNKKIFYHGNTKEFLFVIINNELRIMPFFYKV